MPVEAIQNLQKDGAQLLREIFQGGRRFNNTDIFLIDSLRNFPEEVNEYFMETRHSNGAGFHELLANTSNLEQFHEYSSSITSSALRTSFNQGFNLLWEASLARSFNERNAKACSDISMLSCPERPKLDLIVDDGKGLTILQRQAAVAKYSEVTEKIKTYAAVECIVVAIWDRASETGALAHIDSATDLNNAASVLKDKFKKLELDLSNLEVTIVGGRQWLKQIPEQFARKLAGAGFKNFDFKLYSEETPLSVEFNLKDGVLRRLDGNSLVIDDAAYVGHKNRILKPGADKRLEFVPPL